MESLKTIRDPRVMQELAESLRMRGKRIAFVPTMGYLHEGHLSLMREGKKRADILVASIFVNPTQFGPNEDLNAYPRDFEHDLEGMREVGVDIVFHPTVEAMYGQGFQTYVNVEEVSQNLCGRSRPGHFRGVATVLTKLFHIVKPHIALFGEKDFQQLVVVRRMVKDLNFDVEIVGCPTVREHDGLAMSSRNSYLNQEERRQALAIKEALDRAQELYRRGERRAEVLVEEAKRILEARPSVRIDYVKACDATTLSDLETVEKGSVLAVAAFVGKTRLIDNRVLL